MVNTANLPCCVSWTTAAGSFVEMATGVAPTAGILISASGGSTLPLASTGFAADELLAVALPAAALRTAVLLLLFALLAVAAGYCKAGLLPILLGT